MAAPREKVENLVGNFAGINMRSLNAKVSAL